MKPTRSIVSDTNPSACQTTIEGKLAVSRMRDGSPRSSIWEPVSGAAPSPSAATSAPIPIEGEILGVIVQPLEAGETHRGHNDRKERELLAVLDRLTPIEALTLHRRLISPHPQDPLVQAFGRLVVDRRNRVIAFIADTRRRIARRRA